MAMRTGQPRWGPPSTVTATSAPPQPAFSSSFTTDPPAEFLCPISGTLMADPVVVPPGQIFERACIQACSALAFSPPAVTADLSSSASSSSPLVLVPNVALRTAILNWCDRLALPHPAPLSLDTAHDIVRRLMPQQEEQPSLQLNRPPQQAATSVRVRRRSTGAEDFVQEPMRTGGSLEEEIMAVLAAEGASPAELAAAMASLRQATRENREVRGQLCTPRLLAALRPMLLSADADVQVNAAAVMVNLSLEPENKVRIVRSGAVSPLVDVLRGGHPEARDHAAGAMYSLAVEDENRAAIGVLGAIPPLLELFASAMVGYRARREAGMALYHVSLSGMNRSKIARAPGAVRTLLAAAEVRDRANEADAAKLRKLAVMILANLAGCPDGRAALMDGGAVAAIVRLMRNGSAAPGSAEEEYCISTLYGMSRGSLRFRGLARAAGVEAALQPVAEGDGRVGRDMARRTLRAMCGEDDEAPVTAAGLLGRQWDDRSVVSEGLVSIRRPPHRSNYAGPSGSNTTQF
ncbi:U-box domain-containing protein 40-like [Phragmites australis]|uniref:U-box domain-containing protein 40-like n=1 Tax=Phragmites australis TaxID=29695 RepID=UPI002D7895B0|nr:U-box domain-containing protein 40-like [Phragmites australis]